MLAASMPPEYKYLGEYLISDIQGSPPHAQEVLNEALSVKTGAKNVWEQIGNAYSLKVTQTTTLIEGQWEKVRVEVPTVVFIQAVLGWLKFLKSPDYKTRN